MQIDKVIGQRIRDYRNVKGVGQADLAYALGVTLGMMQSFEMGHQRILPSQLWRIADVLGISVVRLFQEDMPTGLERGEVQDMLDNFDTLPALQKSCVLRQMRALSCPELKPLCPPKNKRLL